MRRSVKLSPNPSCCVNGGFAAAHAKHARLSTVMPALVAGIHVFKDRARSKTWMAGTKPGHDVESASISIGSRYQRLRVRLPPKTRTPERYPSPVRETNAERFFCL